MYRMHCSEVWGGIKGISMDVRTNALTASLYSHSCDGGKGGDIYYLSVCDNDLLTRIAIADVVGHGQPVNHISQWLYEGLVVQMNSLDGHRILTLMNSMAHQHGLEAMTTAAVVSYYIADSNLYFSYAGHPPFIRRREDKQWQAVDLLHPRAGRANMPLGIFSDVAYDQEQISIAKGDRLFIYTDGVVESPDAEGNLFEQEGLLSVLEEFGNKSLTELKEAVLAAIHRHTGGSLTHDDITLMAVEVN